MDTSKKYVEMSKEAKRWLSNYFKGKPGDLYVGLNGKIHMVDSNIITDGTLHPDCTPLFRQDQLQEIILPMLRTRYQDKSPLPWNLNMSKLGCEANWMISILQLRLKKIKSNSMEQLWLAFVMKEKYQKVWDDKKKKWIKCQVAQQEG